MMKKIENYIKARDNINDSIERILEWYVDGIEHKGKPLLKYAANNVELNSYGDVLVTGTLNSCGNSYIDVAVIPINVFNTALNLGSSQPIKNWWIDTVEAQELSAAKQKQAVAEQNERHERELLRILKSKYEG